MWSRTSSNSCLRVTTSGSRPRASGERRFCVVDVLPSKIGDHGYFKKIREEIEPRGLRGDALRPSTSRRSITQTPQTDAAFHQKVLGDTDPALVVREAENGRAAARRLELAARRLPERKPRRSPRIDLSPISSGLN